MTTKYAPLAAFLDQPAATSLELTFAEIERILGFALGESARRYEISRYDVIKDLVRLESFVDDGYADMGWSITLTNDSAYLRPVTKTDPIDAAFRIHHGELLEGTLGWSGRAGDGTTRGRAQPHALRDRYLCDWQPYGELADGEGARQIWFLALAVAPKSDVTTEQ